MVTAGLLALGVVVAAATGHEARTYAFRHHASTQRYEDVYYLPSPDTLVATSFGYREALADLLWMKTLIYFSDELVHRGDKENLLRYAEALLGLDPYFQRIYRWVGTMVLYRKGKPSREDMLDAVVYLERGFELFPDDGELAWTLGATYAYELTQFEDDPADRETYRLKGHDYIRIAVLKGAAPDWLASATARHFAKVGRKEEALKHLREVHAVARKPGDRKQLEAQIAKLEGEAYVERLRAHAKTFRERRMGNYPYLPPGLFALVGDRSEDVDIDQMRAGFDPAGPAPELDAAADAP